MLASGIGRQPLPCSAFVVFHHLDGLLLLDPLRMLHRSSGHGVRDVSSSTPLLSSSRVPALRSFAPCTQRVARGWRTILVPGQRHRRGLPRRSPLALPPRPWFPWTARLFSAYRALSHGVLPPSRDRCSLGLVRVSCCAHLEGATIPVLALGVRPHQLTLGRHIRSG